MAKPNHNLTPKPIPSVKPKFNFIRKNVDSKKVQPKTSVVKETIDISKDEFTDGLDLFGKPTNRKNFFDQEFDSDSSQ